MVLLRIILLGSELIFNNWLRHLPIFQILNLLSTNLSLIGQRSIRIININNHNKNSFPQA
jgi:hypothetical protein